MITLHKVSMMETTIRINTDLLNQDIVDNIRRMYPHRIVAITVQPADDTEFILSNPAYAAELKSRIDEYNTTRETIDVRLDDLL